jgi:hypothetical protein
MAQRNFVFWTLFRLNNTSLPKLPAAAEAAGTRFFGIRHHGPGSARSLVRALEAWAPDIVLIEGPPDAAALLPLAADAGMQPPVALLVYNPRQMSQASFFPFAEFSPEWQALRYGLARRIPVRFIDLPLSLSFALPAAENSPALLFHPEAEEEFVRDPFRHMAHLAGYSDPERWWEALVERSDGGDDAIFPAIHHLMSALREEKAAVESFETLLREAWMRQAIRLARKEGHARIAVVCGAWHTPALAAVDTIKATVDAAFLKGLKKVRTECTWIPWSFDRLSTQSSYRSGVLAPAWYRILFQSTGTGAPENGRSASATAEWLTQAARLLREHDLVASSAHVIEATRLAETLAVLRRTALPGIEELREAAVAVLCEGAPKPLELIDRRLVIGDVLGAVPAMVAVPPLKADFEAQARSCRLERSTEERPLELDLREAAHLRKSHLLHRLALLGIPWGHLQEAPSGKQGTFHEHWKMKWLPDFEIRLLEAGAWGNTVEEAAIFSATRTVGRSGHLADLTRLLGVVLKADLPAVVPALVEKLHGISALSTDTLPLAEAILPLAEVLRYGSARRLNLEAVEALLARIVPRVCLQLPAAGLGLEEEAAVQVLKILLSVNRAVGLLQNAAYDRYWQQALSDLRQAPAAAPLVAGFAARLLYDKGVREADATGDDMRFRLSHGQPAREAALWLEGFLQGSGLLLLHHPPLWELLDDWVRSLSPETFPELLPLLRRTFSRFSGPEREKMLNLVKQGEPALPAGSAALDWNPARVEKVLPLLRLLLGKEEG